MAIFSAQKSPHFNLIVLDNVFNDVYKELKTKCRWIASWKMNCSLIYGYKWNVINDLKKKKPDKLFNNVIHKLRKKCW